MYVITLWLSARHCIACTEISFITKWSFRFWKFETILVSSQANIHSLSLESNVFAALTIQTFANRSWEFLQHHCKISSNRAFYRIRWTGNSIPNSLDAQTCITPNRFRCDGRQSCANKEKLDFLGVKKVRRDKAETERSSVFRQNASSHFQIKPYRRNIPRASFVRRNCSMKYSLI